MTAEDQTFDEAIRDAVEAHGAGIGTTSPDFAELLAGRARRTRRLLATTTLGVALLGVGGVVVASNRSQPPGNPAADTRPAETEHALPTTLVEYFCTEPLGEDQLGRELFGSCEPAVEGSRTDFACTDRLGTDGTGRVRFSECEAVGQLGQVPTDGYDPLDAGAAGLPVRADVYVVQPGDYGLKVALELCVELSDLEAVNGWSDHAREFPGPGSEILIPLDSNDDAAGCEVGTYVVTADDVTRIGVADKFCISVEALDTANRETDGYSGFYPGLEIRIPPSSDDSC